MSQAQVFDSGVFHVKGWIPDRPDNRDRKHRFRAVGPVPDAATLEQWLPRCEDQRTLGSCVGHGTTSAMELLYNKAQRPVRELSRLFTYYIARRAEGSVDSDEGCCIRDAVACLNQIGCAREETWPYDIARFAVEPPPEAFAEAAQHKLTSYRRCYTLHDIKSAIAEGFPVVFGFSVPETSMWTHEAMTTGDIPMPAPGEGFSGGHCVMAFGYTPDRIAFFNSWGVSWGRNGCGTLPVEYFTEGLATDAWAICDEDYYARREQPPTDQAAA